MHSLTSQAVTANCFQMLGLSNNLAAHSSYKCLGLTLGFLFCCYVHRCQSDHTGRQDIVLGDCGQKHQHTQASLYGFNMVQDIVGCQHRPAGTVLVRAVLPRTSSHDTSVEHGRMQQWTVMSVTLA